jgi:hypothetical protein
MYNHSDSRRTKAAELGSSRVIRWASLADHPAGCEPIAEAGRRAGLEEASDGCELDREAPEALETAQQRRFFGHRHSGEARPRLHKGHRAAQASCARGAAARARENARGKQGPEGARPQPRFEAASGAQEGNSSPARTGQRCRSCESRAVPRSSAGGADASGLAGHSPVRSSGGSLPLATRRRATRETVLRCAVCWNDLWCEHHQRMAFSGTWRPAASARLKAR